MSDEKRRRRRRRRRRPDRSSDQSDQPSPEEIEEIEEEMLERWINTPLEGPGSPTPKELAETPEGRRELLDMIEHAEALQRQLPESSGARLFNYRKVRKMLNLE